MKIILLIYILGAVYVSCQYDWKHDEPATIMASSLLYPLGILKELWLHLH